MSDALTGGIAGMGGTSSGSAHGSIVIDTESLRQAANVARQASRQIEQALDGVDTGTRRVETGFGRMEGAVRSLGTVIVSYLTVRTAQAAVGLATLSARVAGVRQEFQNLTQTTAQESEVMLQSMRRASWGLISDMALIQQANKAILFGVVEDIADMDRLLLIASARAAAMGTTTEDAFERLVHGIGTLNPIVLRQLGLAVSLTDAYEKYAQSTGKVADKLDEAEKRQAILNIAYEESADLIERQAEVGQTNAGNLERATIAADNARAAFGGLIEEDVVTWATRSAQALERLTRLMNTIRDAPAFGARLPDVFALITGGVTEQAAVQERARRNMEAMRQELESAVAAQEKVFGAGNLAAVQAWQRHIEILTADIAALNRELARVSLQPPIGGTSPFAGLAGVGATVASPAAAAGPSTELLSAQRDFYRSVQDIERGAANDRLSATRQFEQQRSETVRAYGLSRAREAEDFARQRARSVAQHEDSIARIRSDAADRETRAAADLADRIAGFREQLALRQADAQEDFDRRRAEQQRDFEERRAEQQAAFDDRMVDLRETGAKRLAQVERDAERQRERALRQHQDTLLNAASRLDARAVAQEMRRFAVASSEQEQALNERVNTERANLDERIEQEQEAHEKRLAQDRAAYEKRTSQEQEQFDRRRAREERDLQRRIAQEQAAHAKRIADAREADEQRIADQQEAFQAQLAQEDEDRAIRLARQEADHRAQLAQMARAHGERMAAIDRQEGERLKAEEDAFQARLDELGLFNIAWRDKQRQEQDKATALFQEMWDDWADTMEGAWQAAREAAADAQRTPFEEMTPDAGLGFEGSGTPVLPASTTNTRSSNLSVTNHIYPSAGMDERALAGHVRREMLEVLQEVNR